METKHLRIRGRVQGVFYRESMCREAARLKICGWVRNRGDGSVEAIVQGQGEAVDALIDWARRGPDRAQVERVEVSEGAGDYSRFERLADA